MLAFPLESPRFSPRPINIGFLVGKVVLGQVSLQVVKFSPVSIITPILYICIYSSVFDIM